MPSVEQYLAQLGGALMVSKLDTHSGFYQIKLYLESALLSHHSTDFASITFPLGLPQLLNIVRRICHAY